LSVCGPPRSGSCQIQTQRLCVILFRLAHFRSPKRVCPPDPPDEVPNGPSAMRAFSSISSFICETVRAAPGRHAGSAEDLSIHCRCFGPTPHARNQQQHQPTAARITLYLRTNVARSSTAVSVCCCHAALRHAKRRSFRNPLRLLMFLSLPGTKDVLIPGTSSRFGLNARQVLSVSRSNSA